MAVKNETRKRTSRKGRVWEVTYKLIKDIPEKKKAAKKTTAKTTKAKAKPTKRKTKTTKSKAKAAKSPKASKTKS